MPNYGNYYIGIRLLLLKEYLQANAGKDRMVNRYKLFGNDPRGLYLLDQEYAARVYTAPSLVL